MRKLWFGVLLMSLAAAVMAGPKEDIKEDMQAGRWVAADAKLVKVLHDHPNNAQAHYWMAQVKEREGLPVMAREHLEKARELAPDLSFAGSREAVTEMERRLTLPAVQRAPSAGLQTPAPVAHEAPKAAVQDSGHGMFFWLFVLGIPAAIVFFLIRRAGGRRDQSDERTRLQAELRDLASELRDAEKAIDGRAELNAEQKMALADRLSQAQGDLAREVTTLKSRTDFAATRMLIVRLRDIAAEARGEEKPSLRAEREAMERAAAQQYAPAYPPQGVQAPGTSAGSAIAAGVGGLVAGAALGSLLGGATSAHAHERRGDDDHGFDRGAFDNGSTPGTLDFGNDSGSSDDWSSGADVGGDSGGGDW